MNLKQVFTKITTIAVLAFFATLGASASLPSLTNATEKDRIKGPFRPCVEIMSVLDTTGRMGELIAAAKDKIVSIANTIASANPTPDIKMGLGPGRHLRHHLYRLTR